MAGMPGSGKSTLAPAVGRALGWSVIDKDTLVATLLANRIPEEAAQPCSYDLLFAIGRDLLVEQQLSVILDSPAGVSIVVERAAAVAREAKATFKVVLCLADQETRNRRVAERIGKLPQPVRQSTTPGDGHERFAHLPAGTLVVDTTRPLPEVIEIESDPALKGRATRDEAHPGLRTNGALG